MSTETIPAWVRDLAEGVQALRDDIADIKRRLARRGGSKVSPTMSAFEADRFYRKRAGTHRALYDAKIVTGKLKEKGRGGRENLELQRKELNAYWGIK
jgi:hypothetical protein